MSEKRSGKTIGVFVDEDAYARYAGLGLWDRKQALAAAKAALLEALGDADRGIPVVKKSFTTEGIPTTVKDSFTVETVPVPVETPVVEKPAVPAPVETPVTEKPVAVEVVGTAADPAADQALAGFLDAGW